MKILTKILRAIREEIKLKICFRNSAFPKSYEMSPGGHLSSKEPDRFFYREFYFSRLCFPCDMGHAFALPQFNW